jgi:hypothetical protein
MEKKNEKTTVKKLSFRAERKRRNKLNRLNKLKKQPVAFSSFILKSNTLKKKSEKYFIEKQNFDYKPYLKTFLNAYVRDGKKKKIYNILKKMIILLKIKYKNLKSDRFLLDSYFKQVFYNMRPIMYFKYRHCRGERLLLP